MASMSLSPRNHSLVIHPLLTNVGGSETVCFLIMKALVDSGHNVELMTSMINDEHFPESWRDLSHRIKITKMGGLGPRNFITYLRYLSMWQRIRLVSVDNPDFVILSQELLPGIARFKSSTVALYVHFPPFYGTEDRGEGILKPGYVLPLSRIVERELRNVDMIFCNSRYTKSAIISAWGKYSIPEPLVLHPPPMRKLNSHANWDQRDRAVLYVARFSPFKRHEILRQLSEGMPDVEFHSVGSHSPSYESYFTRLNQAKTDNYHLHVDASSQVLERLYERTRVYVHLAKNEHFGIAPLEAMSAGCVVLAHHSGGPSEYVPKELLWRDLEELRTKIRLFTSDRDAWELWHRRCLGISQMYNYDAFSKNFLEALTC